MILAVSPYQYLSQDLQIPGLVTFSSLVLRLRATDQRNNVLCRKQTVVINVNTTQTVGSGAGRLNRKCAHCVHIKGTLLLQPAMCQGIETVQHSLQCCHQFAMNT